MRVSKKRGRLQIYLEILRVVKDGKQKPTHIMYKANLSWKPIQKILKLMLAQGLIVMKNVGKGKRYYITERGRDVLKHFNKARESGLPIDRLNRVIM